jgi:hypothetical protein
MAGPTVGPDFFGSPPKYWTYGEFPPGRKFHEGGIGGGLGGLEGRG